MRNRYIGNLGIAADAMPSFYVSVRTAREGVVEPHPTESVNPAETCERVTACVSEQRSTWRTMKLRSSHSRAIIPTRPEQARRREVQGHATVGPAICNQSTSL